MFYKAGLALVLCMALLAVGCMGTNNAYFSVQSWNAQVSDMNWLNTLIFYGLWIIPVYELAFLGDVLIFNTIAYWGDKNPISEPKPFPPAYNKK